jgi:type I restriction enzyme R subunit
VEDGVLVPYNVFEIETKITKEGSKISLGEYIDTREKLTRKKFWNKLDEDVEYSAKQLDDKVVNPNQIRLIIRAVRDALPTIFPDRFVTSSQPFSKGEGQEVPSPSERVEGEVSFEVPKMLIFAKSDSHADGSYKIALSVLFFYAIYCLI